MSTQTSFTPTPTLPQISSTILPSSSIPSLVTLLQSHLPYSLPLYRRLQFHLQHPNPPSARVFLARVQVGGSGGGVVEWLQDGHDAGLEGGGGGGGGGGAGKSETPWLAAHVDLMYVGQTQAYVFASWEGGGFVSQASTRSSGSTRDGVPTVDIQRSLLNSLFETLVMSPLFMPSQPPTAPPAHQLLQQTGKYTTPYSRWKVLMGAVEEGVAGLVEKRAVARQDGGYAKFLFEAGGDGDGPLLPRGYRFGEMGEDFLQVVLDRTAVPRTIETLRTLGRVGVFWEGEDEDRVQAGVEGGEGGGEGGGGGGGGGGEGGDSESPPPTAIEKDPLVSNLSNRLTKMQRAPVAWGFLGKDASLTSLHTEPKHRGKGLALAVARKLIEMQGECFKVKGGGEWTRWAHADVAESNRASRSVMEKVGGRVGWRVAWVEVDCEKLDLGGTGNRVE